MKPASCQRSFLFVPGDDLQKLRRAAISDADALVADLEDSVLPDQKQAARQRCLEFSAGRKPSMPLLLRINSVRSTWFPQDMEACREIRPDGIVLPKCELPSDVQAVIEAVGESMLDSSIYALIETPLGLLRAEQIATVSKTVVALAFGAEDFCGAAGIPRTQDEMALVHARCSIVMVAKAHGLAAIDSPNFSLEEPELVRRAGLRARALGFTGMFAIHPRQLSAINEVFTPSPQEVEEAVLILQEAAARGVGAFRWKGQMVDEAMLRRARGILERQEGRVRGGS